MYSPTDFSELPVASGLPRVEQGGRGGEAGRDAALEEGGAAASDSCPCQPYDSINSFANSRAPGLLLLHHMLRGVSKERHLQLGSLR